MAGVLPVELLYLFDSEEVETLICGSSDVSVSFLKSVTEYDGVSPTDPHILMFWCVPSPTDLCAMGFSVRACGLDCVHLTLYCGFAVCTEPGRCCRNCRRRIAQHS